MKQASVSSTDNGGGKRRGVIAKPKAARRSAPREHSREGVVFHAVSGIGEQRESEGGQEEGRDSETCFEGDRESPN